MSNFLFNAVYYAAEHKKRRKVH